MFTVIVLSVAIVLLYVYGKIKYLRYWENIGVPYLNTLGMGQLKTLIGRKCVCDTIVETYQLKPQEKIVGVYHFGYPSLIVRDPEVIRQLLVKDFDYFIDHFAVRFINEVTEPYLYNSVVLVHGEKWRKIRATLNPAFTSAKMKGMISLIAKCGKQMVDFYDSILMGKQGSFVDVELKNMATSFSTDVIASTVFGLEVNTFTNPDNTFAKVGKEFTTINVWKSVKNVFMPLWLKKLLNHHVYSNELMTYFQNTLNKTIAVRERDNIQRPDLINLLMEAMKGTLKNENKNSQAKETEFSVNEDSLHETSNKKKMVLSLDEATIQALTFLMAGYESASTVISLGLYEITINPTIKRRLENEIDEILEANNGSLTYENIKEMNYLDMVVSEILRKHPPTWASDRVCVKDYSFNLDGRTISIKKGMPLLILILGMHRDPKYYPNPDKFDPERFNSENKEKIKPYTYCPFGIGPRACLAPRFAILIIKIGLIYLLSNFDLFISPKTQVPVKPKPMSFFFIAEKGLWIQMKMKKRRVLKM